MVRYLFYTIGDLTYQIPLVIHTGENKIVGNVTQSEKNGKEKTEILRDLNIDGNRIL